MLLAPIVVRPWPLHWRLRGSSSSGRYEKPVVSAAAATGGVRAGLSVGGPAGRAPARSLWLGTVRIPAPIGWSDPDLRAVSPGCVVSGR